MPDCSTTTLHDAIKRISVLAVEATIVPMRFTFGTVKSVSPLEIFVEQKYTLSEVMLILTDAVRDYYVEATVDHWTENETAHTHTIHDTYTNGGSSDPTSHRHEYTGRKRFLIHNGLQVGEKVILLQQKGGQKYLVLNRVVDA